MADQPSNAVSRCLAAVFDALNSTPLEELDALEMDIMTEDFIRHDRRPLVAMPTTGVDGMAASIRSYFEVGHGTPAFAYDVVELRGERLGLVRAVVRYPDGWAIEVLLVIQVDSGLVRMEQVVQFDSAQGDEAARELDRLHAVLMSTAGEQP